MCLLCSRAQTFLCASVPPAGRGFLERAARLVAACAPARAGGPEPAAGQDASRTADLLLANARVVTLDRARPAADSIAIAGDTILGAGSRREMERFRGAATRVLDLGGRTVVPGLNDSHTHFIRGGLTYAQELRWDGVPSLALALAMLRDQARRTPPPHWVQVVGGFSAFQFAERRLPSLDEINAATGETPCFILHLYDRAFLNRAAMRVLGWGRDVPDPAGGVIERDRAGNPTGLVVSTTSLASLVSIFAQVPKLPPEDEIVSTRLYMRELNRLGVTSVSDAGGAGQDYPDHYRAIAELAARNELTLRIGYTLFAQRPGREIDDFRRWTSEAKAGQGDGFLRLTGAGEYLVWSAVDPANFAKEVIPPPAIMEAQLVEVVRLLVANRWPFRLHAAYDQTIRRILGVLEQVHRDTPLTGLRWAIDHAETVSPESLERVAAMGGGIGIQNRMSLDGEAFIARWGGEAAADAPPVGRIRAMGLPLSCGTDANRASSHNPWIGVEWLVTGRTMGGVRHQAERNLLDRTEALRLYTAGAWFSGEEESKGTIAPGKWADLAVLSRDYLSIPENEISGLSSVLTMVGGRIVHGEDAFAGLAPPPPQPGHDWLPAASRPGCYGASRAAAAPGGSDLRRRLDGIMITSEAGSWRLGCACGLL